MSCPGHIKNYSGGPSSEKDPKDLHHFKGRQLALPAQGDCEAVAAISLFGHRMSIIRVRICVREVIAIRTL